MERKAFLLFTIKRKTIFESHLTSYGTLTALIKIHLQLSHVMELRVIFNLRTRTVLNLDCNLHVALVLVKFSLCQDENLQENVLPIFVSKEAEEPAGSASNKIFGS